MGYSTKEGTEELEDERIRHLLKELLGLKTMHVKWALSLLQIVQGVKIVSSEVEIRISCIFCWCTNFYEISISFKFNKINSN